VKTTYFSGYVHRFSLAAARSRCDSVPNPLNCEKHPSGSAAVPDRSAARHPALDDACEITRDLSEHFRASWGGIVSRCNNGDGPISRISLFLTPSKDSGEPLCSCAIGSRADVILQSQGVAFAYLHSDIVNYRDLLLRTTNKIGGNITRIHNRAPPIGPSTIQLSKGKLHGPQEWRP
jgi:hypothetical protein